MINLSLTEPSLITADKKATEWYSKFNWAANPFDAKTVMPETFVGYEEERNRTILYIINGGGYALIKGPVGAGKTTLCRWLENEIRKDPHYVSVFFEEPPLDVNLVDEKIKSSLESGFASKILNHLFSKNSSITPITPNYLNKKLGGVNGKKLVIFLDEAHLHFRDNKNQALEVMYRLKDIVDMHPNCRLIISGLFSENVDIETILPDAVINRISPANKFILSRMNNQQLIDLVLKRIQKYGGNSLTPFNEETIVTASTVFNGAPRSLLLFLSFCVSKMISDGAFSIDKQRIMSYLTEYGALKEIKTSVPLKEKNLFEMFSPMQIEIIKELSKGSRELEELTKKLNANVEPIRTQIKRINEKCISSGMMEAIRVEKKEGRGRGKYVYSLNDHVARFFAAE